MNGQDASSGATAPNRNRQRRYVAAAAILVALAGGAYYVKNYHSSGGKIGFCPTDGATALKPMARGELAAFVVADAPQPFPQITFAAPDGREMTLDAFKGKTVLVNLWATWCVPCRREMPALDRLQAELGGKDFEVLAINVDTGGPEKPRKWLEDNGIGKLAFYSDKSGSVLKALQRSGHVVGLPTTVLVGPDGCQSGILRGGAEWASDDALKLIRAALKPKT